MIRQRVVATGMGIISALGNGVEANRDALIHNRHGISDISVLPTQQSGILPAGEIKLTNHRLQSLSGLTSGNIPRTILLSAIAIKEALEQSKPEIKNTDLYYATTVGGISLSEDLIAQHLKSQEPDYDGFIYHDCGAGTAILANHFSLKGRRYAISTACSSSANSIGRSALDIIHGKCRYAIAGGGDALCRFTLNGFNSLMILDKQLCSPMDQNRRGLNLGEGAAFLVLESESNALERGAEILAYVSGFGNANDSHHQTASSDDGIGAQLAMKKALESAALSPDEISYINAHGTGTLNNDKSEGLAVQSIFDTVPPIASTKSFTGHTLAASGSVEAVFSILAIQNNEIYPTLRFKNPIEGLLFSTFSSTRQHEVHHVLSNSFGFGGNCSSLIFSKK
ncbi:MAG: beta-ketoacyl-[acyl-carrier-protein] synthase family protein [Saprospiraceae bacterium]|nr:beta-ketoacyl-[acyl-carrier-protein] synthase family protein [Saprospiraceae bacterium]